MKHYALLLCVALLGSYLFSVVWSMVSADLEVLLFFIGLPALIGLSFGLISAQFKQRMATPNPYRAGLFAAALAGVLIVGLPRLINGISLPAQLGELFGLWMIQIIWLGSFLLSSLYVFRVRHKPR